MVGHTGDMKAAIIACETVDKCAETVITTALNNGYTTIVIADHGNCETMINPDGSPNTAHTTNPVPLIIVDPDIKEIKDGGFRRYCSYNFKINWCYSTRSNDTRVVNLTKSIT